MKTVSLKLPESLLRVLEQQAKARRVSKSTLIRTSLERELFQPSDTPSCYDLSKDLIGSLKGGPSDLATNPKYMEGYGEQLEPVTIIDAGPLVTLLTARGEHAKWTIEQWKLLRPPLITSESVLSEAAFLLGRGGFHPESVFAFVSRGLIEIGLNLSAESSSVHSLMTRYRNVPMSLADACLVRLSELHVNSRIFTYDSDFRVYRRLGNRVIPLLMPESPARR